MTGRPQLVVDIGGTSLRMSRLGDDRQPEGTQRRPTPSLHAGENPLALLDTLARRLEEMTRAVDGVDPEAVVIGFPGPIRRDGQILAAPTVWQGNNRLADGVAPLLREAWPGAHVTILNDVTAAGYSIVESGQGDFALVTISSGVGAKLFLDGRPVLGNGAGGEIGHVTYASHKPPIACECGGSNHLGAVASGRGVLAVYDRLRSGRPGVTGPLVRTEEVLDAALRGDATALTAVDSSAAAVAHSLALTHSLTGVSTFFLMGGVVDHLGSLYVNKVRRAAARSCDWLGQDWARMVHVHPERDPGLAGAAAYLRMHHPVLGGVA